MMCLIEGSDKYILVGEQYVTTYNTGSTEAVVKYVVYRLAIAAILILLMDNDKSCPTDDRSNIGRPNGQAYQTCPLGRPMLDWTAVGQLSSLSSYQTGELLDTTQLHLPPPRPSVY